MANSQAGLDTIEFDLPADDAGHVYYQDDGIAGQVTLANVAVTTEADDANIADIDPDWAHSWWTISPTSLLPNITDVVIIDGYTQTGASANTNPVGQGLNTVLRVEIDGSQTAMENDTILTGLLTLQEASGTIRGLAINRAFGVELLIEDTNTASVEGNFIGTNISGTQVFDLSALPTFTAARGLHGVRTNSSTNIVIGGTSPAARNLVSGSTGVGFLEAGISISGNGNRVEGNLIGTDRTGTLGLGGQDVGVSIGSGVTVGGSDANSANLISGNRIGVLTGDTPTGTTILVQGNLIGTDVTGANTVGNTLYGVQMQGSNAQIIQNTIAFNGSDSIGAGVGIGQGGGSGGNGNLVRENSIFSNIGLGIDLDIDQETPNDVPPGSDPPDQDTGPNGLQNVPVLTSATATGGGTTVAGTLASTPSSMFRIDFYTSSERDTDDGRGDNSGQFGEGETFLGFVIVATDASGNATISANLPALPSGQPFITATATDITNDGSGPRNNTSEFSAIVTAGAPSFVVTTTADSGPGSLREAIINANLTAGPQTITFNIPANDANHFYYRDDGVAGQVTFENTTVTTEADDANIVDIDPDWTHSWFGIILDTALPVITDTITLDGYSQPGAMENTLSSDAGLGLDTVLKVELDGVNVDGNGFTLGFDGLISDAAGSVIRGFAISGFLGDAIHLNTLGGSNTVAGNFIGPDVSGTLNFGNFRSGIFVRIDPDARIGGANEADRNLISGGIQHGVVALSARDLQMRGNIHGGNRTLTKRFETDGPAILVTNDDAMFSGLAVSDVTTGFELIPNAAAPTEDITLFEEQIIYDARIALLEIRREEMSQQHFPTQAEQLGILLIQAVDGLNVKTRVRYGPGDSAPQTLSIETVAASLVAAVTSIDLNGDGVTPNDPLDADDGPNGLQNYPVLTSAVTDAGVTTVNGTLHSVPNTSFRIEIYSSSYDTHMFRAGERSLGMIDVTTDANGNAEFTFVSPEVVPLGHDVISLATRLEDGTLTPIETSEFSAGLEVTDGLPPAPVRHDLLGLRPSDVRFEAQKSNGTSFTRDADAGFLAFTAALTDHLVGDFNGDGLDDIVARRDATGEVIVALSDGTDMVPSVWTFWSPFATWDRVVVGDFNRDGMDDLAGLSSSGAFIVSLSRGTSFDNVSFGNVSGTVNWVDLFVGDVNADGFDDVILRSDTGAWVAGQSDGIRFQFSLFGRWSPFVAWEDVTTGDFNGDGRLDVVGRAPSGKVVVGLSDGSRFNFSIFSIWSTAVTWETHVGDFNSDGMDDILSRASSGTMVMNLSTGTGFTRSVWSSLSTAVDWLFFIGDFDADGDDDLAGIASTGTLVVGLSTGANFNYSVWGGWPDRDTRTPYFVGNFLSD